MVVPFTDKAAAHPVLRRAYLEALDANRLGATWQPSTPAQFWAQQNKAMHDSAAYRAILAVCAAKDQPSSFAVDVSRVDRDFILEAGDQTRFFWGVRPWGTALMLFRQDATPREAAAELEMLAAEFHVFPDLEWYEWDGKALHRRTNREWMRDELRRWADRITNAAEVR